MASELRRERFTGELAQLYADLSGTEYADNATLSREYYLWKFLDNPEGVCMTHNLYENGSLQGRIAYFLRKFYLGSRSFTAGYIVDLLIHPRARGIKTFMKLISGLRDVEGTDFLYVTPGTGSLPLFEKVVKSRPLFKLDVFLFPLRPFNLLGIKLSGKPNKLLSAMDCLIGIAIKFWSRPSKRAELTFSASPPQIQDFERFLASVYPQNGMIGRRDPVFLEWRFNRSPYHRYETTYLYKDGAFRGYYVTSSQTYRGYRALFVVDFLLDPSLSNKNINDIKKRIISRGLPIQADLVLALFNSSHPLSERFGALPFIKAPAQALPQEVPLFFEGNAELGEQLTSNNFYVTAADLDIF